MTPIERRSLFRAAGRGAVLGIALVAILGVLALGLNPPGGIGEARIWFGLYSIVWSMPLALAVEALWPTARVPGLALAIIANWALLGLIVGVLRIAFLRRRALRRETVVARYL